MRGTQFAELGAFIAVAEEASFTKAAKRLGLSTATLSHTIRALEERIGVRLLTRTTRSVATTEAGERLLVQLRPLLDGFNTAMDSLNDFRERPVGNLRLSMPPPVARLYLAPVLARFQAQYPEINIEVVVEAGLPDIVAGRFDAGFRRGNVIARDMIAIRVTEDAPRATLCAPHYLARCGEPEHPSDLLAHNCIRLHRPGGDFIPWRFTQDGKTTDLDVRGSLTVNDPELAVRAALEGIGVIHIIEDYVATLIADGRLVKVLDGFDGPAESGFFLYYPSRRQNSAALQALIDFVRDDLRRNGKRRMESAKKTGASRPEDGARP